MDTQITEILAAVNENLIQAVTHGNIITQTKVWLCCITVTLLKVENHDLSAAR